MRRYESYFFHLMVLLALSMVLLPAYYLTGDGASHTYNAKVLFDVALGRERDFYEQFFVINRNIDPNWMSHLVLGTLLQGLPARLADKGFQVLYILTFAYGFRYLLRSVHRDNGFLAFLFFPLLFTQPFQQGFYNYCLSLALLCWTLGYYLRRRDRMHEARVQLMLSVLLLMTAFSHGMPALYAMALMGLLWLSERYQLLHPRHGKQLLEEGSRLALVMLPSVFLILLFLAKRGSGTVPHAWSVARKFTEFLKGWTSQSTRSDEVYPAVAFGVLVAGMLLYWLASGRKQAEGARRETGLVFLLFAGFTFYSYLNCPHSIGGAGSIDIRLGYLPPLFLLVFLAGAAWKPMMRKGFISLSFLIALGFLILRFPYVMQASRITEDIVRAGEHIPDRSVVLNLNLDAWQRIGAGDSLFQRDGSFIHAGDFVGAQGGKHLILVMNYEAEINYFPVNWAQGKNPRESIAGLIPGNYPPCGDPLAYERQIGRPLDFVLLHNLRTYPNCSRELQAQLDAHFEKVYAGEFVALYHRRKTDQ